MFDEVLKNQWVRVGLFLLAFVLVCLTAYILSPVLIPLLTAFFVAYILDPLVDKFEARGHSRAKVVAVLGLIGVVALFTIPPFAIISIKNQAQDLIQRPTSASGDAFLDRMEDWMGLDDLVTMMGWDQDEVPPPLDAADEPAEEPVDPPQDAEPDPDPEAEPAEESEEPAAEEEPPADTEVEAKPDTGEREIDARQIIAQRIGRYVQDNAVNIIQQHSSFLTSAGQEAGFTVLGIFRRIGNVLVGLILTLGNIALFAFVSGYLLKDFDTVTKTAGELIPPRFRGKVTDIVKQIDSQLRAFVRGQLTVALFLGAMYTVGFWVSGTPLALMIGAFGVMASFVPYLGIVLTAFFAISLTLLEHGLGLPLVGVLITIAIAQFLEGNVLTPKIVGDQVGLNPVWVILAVLVFGNLLGFVGLLIAVPLAAALKVLVVEAVAYYKQSEVFQPPASPE